MHNNDAIYQASELLVPDSFFSPAHTHIFRAMLDMTEARRPIDEITLVSHLRDAAKIETVGGLPYVLELIDATPVTANVIVYAEIVREKYHLRTLIKAAQDIAARGQSPQKDVRGLIHDAERVFLELSTSTAKQNYSSLSDILQISMAKMEASENIENVSDGLETGIIELDKLTNGFRPSNLIILAARPAMGKTSLALGMARYAAIQKQRVVAFFSMEMSQEELSVRLLCSEGNVDSQRLQAGELHDFEWDNLATASATLGQAQIFIDETSEMTPLAIKAISRRIQAEHGLGLIVVDYLQLMRANHQTSNREQEVAEISRGLKAVAKELKVPVLACAQLNRSLESRPDKRPRLSDLRESGSIEQDADLVMFIYRDEVYNSNTQDEGIAELHVSKHRNGAIRTSGHPIRLHFNPRFTKFGNLSNREE